MDLTNRTKSRAKAVEVLYAYDISGNLQLEDCDEYATILITGVIKDLEKVDNIISENLFNYTINRLNLVDKAIIRVATYELLRGELAKEVIINEAIELTKVYTNLDDDKAKSFNNKLLDNISKYIAQR